MANKDKAAAATDEVRELGPEDEIRDVRPTGDVRELGADDELHAFGDSKADDGDRKVAVTVTVTADQAESLRRLLEANVAGAKVDVRSVGPEKPREPSFGISEGTRDDLERHGKAVSPFTGRTLTRDDLNAER